MRIFKYPQSRDEKYHIIESEDENKIRPLCHLRDVNPVEASAVEYTNETSICLICLQRAFIKNKITIKVI